MQEIFNSGLSIFANYKKELSNCGFGGTAQLERQILNEKFMDIEQVAKHINYCSTNARKKLRDTNVRYIILEEKFYMLRSDVVEQMQPRIKKPKKATIKKEKKKTKKLQKLERRNNLKYINDGATY